MTITPDVQEVARWQAYRRILARERYGARLATIAAMLRPRRAAAQ